MAQREVEFAGRGTLETAGAVTEQVGRLGRAGAVMEPAVTGAVVTGLVGLVEVVVLEAHQEALLAVGMEVRVVKAGAGMAAVVRAAEKVVAEKVAVAAAVAVAQEGMGPGVATAAESAAARKEVAAVAKPVVE